MRVRPLLAALLALVVVVGASGVAAADTSLTITDVSAPDSVAQGDSFDLTVSVSGEELQNDEVDVALTLPEGLSCSPSGTQTVTLTGGTAQATFDCDAEVEGDYAGEITVSASGVSSGDDPDPSRTTQTGLSVISPASLTLSTSIDASSVDEGTTTTVTAVVNNAGDASTSYTLSLPDGSGYSTSLASGTASGTVTGGETRTVEYTVSGDSAGDYTLTASLSGGNGQSLSESESLSVVSTGSGGGGGGSSGGSSGTTATASTTTTATDTETDDADTGTATETGDTGTEATATPASTDAPATTDQSTPTEGGPATDTDGTTADTTGGSGPGFGAVVALVALLLVAFRRRR